MKKVSKKAEQNAPDPNHPRPVSAPIDDSPFAQYGTGDEEKETGAKRTHNVLSNEGVGNSIDKPGLYIDLLCARNYYNGYSQYNSFNAAALW